MVKGELISRSALKGMVAAPATKDGKKQHPLVMAAAQEWPDRRTPGRKLTLEILTQWLAHRMHLPYASAGKSALRRQRSAQRGGCSGWGGAQEDRGELGRFIDHDIVLGCDVVQ
jgi:hypothetical protein